MNDVNSQSWGFENFEVIKTEEDAKIFVETMENIPEPNDKLKKAFRDFNKQETIEEVAKIEGIYRASQNNFNQASAGYNAKWFKRGAIFGAKWQQEQDKNKYSEEEVLDILYKHTEDLLAGKKLTLEQWFEQFKKK